MKEIRKNVPLLLRDQIYFGGGIGQRKKGFFVVNQMIIPDPNIIFPNGCGTILFYQKCALLLQTS